MIMKLESKTRDKLKWDVEKREYRYKNNRKVSNNVVYQAVAEQIFVVEDDITKLTNKLLAKQITANTWQAEMSDLIRNAHVQMMRFGKGGKEYTYAFDYLDVANELKRNQYPKLKNFTKEIKQGALSEAQISSRAVLYARTARASFEKGKKNTQPSNYRGKRLLGKCSPHHPNCVQYAGYGWQKIEDIILPPEHPNCCCTMIYTDKIYLSDNFNLDSENVDLDETYKKYHDAVNMSYSQLLSWSKTKFSKKASINRSPILRNLELLKTKKTSWTKKHIRWANKTIAFIARMKKVKASKPISKEVPYSKKVISLKNWGYDPKTKV